MPFKINKRIPTKINIIVSKLNGYNIDNKTISWEVKQHISMSSEGSRDTEDWSNDAENSALYHRNRKQLYTVGKQLFEFAVIFYNIIVVTVVLIK